MELKPYQQQVINDLSSFLEYLQETKDVKLAFNDYWVKHPVMPLTPFSGTAIEPYKNNVPRVPHVCVKVPTAGGKTFIACNALHTIFSAFEYDRPKAVVWLVPSITILEQTIKNLKDTNHPYRQKINALFGNKVEVFDKAALLQGSGFNASSVREQLSIMVLSFDSLRARVKEDKKVFQENGNLQSFESLLGHEVEITLGSVISKLNPVVIVDESHNAETELSVDMLKIINPCFILDLTATPRKNSNIISFIDAIELKKENMVKLPVIVYNHQDRTEVINSALQLQAKLELQAKEEEKNGGKYIRPIVLFQAQPRNGRDFTDEEEEKSNVVRLKEKLVELKIPEDQIKIKTANINEIKGIDLMSRDCPVRYIITINALKEGWDCPFAYILASLADKSSAVDVEQILGRVLRQPYVMKHNFPLLNLCYVLTASAKFYDTLENIVKGLNKAGFSERDYKLADPVMLEDAKKQELVNQLSVFSSPVDANTPSDITEDIDTARIIIPNGNYIPDTTLIAIEETAIQQIQSFEKVVDDMSKNNTPSIPNEIQKQLKTYDMKEVFKAQAQAVKLPQFHIKVPNGMFNEYGDKPLEYTELLKGFQLSKYDIEINFSNTDSSLYKIDLDENSSEHRPTFIPIDGGLLKESLVGYIIDPSRKNDRIKHLSKIAVRLIGKLDPISEGEISKYIHRVFESFTEEQFSDFLNNDYTYIRKIKQKIESLCDVFAEKKFDELLDTDKVFLKPSYSLPKTISPITTSRSINKSLYEKEGEINNFETSIIDKVANMENILFWTRNIDKRGFKLNGFINHYPDFMIQTKSGKTILLETKGDHLEAEKKIKLGRKWTEKAGANYKYFLVYNEREVRDAYKLDQFINLIREL